MSCKGDWRGRSEAKDVVRERAWAALEASGDARDDDGPRGRIPDFVGAEEAAAALAETPEWQQARIVKSNPDPPQAPLRRRALEEGKTVYVPVPQLTEDTPFLKLDPAALKAKGVAVAAEGGIAPLIALLSASPEIHRAAAGAFPCMETTRVRLY